MCMWVSTLGVLHLALPWTRATDSLRGVGGGQVREGPLNRASQHSTTLCRRLWAFVDIGDRKCF